MATFALHQRYHLQHSADLTADQITALSQVYLPIIGHDAFVLYMFWQTTPETTGLLNHTQLLNITNLGAKTFEKARRQLEGLGLIQTYEQTLSNDTQWTYVLQSPMTIPQFLSDRLLTSLLTHYVSETVVQQMVATVQKNTAEPAGKNVSQSFFELIGDHTFTPIDKAPMSAPTTEQITKVRPEDKLNIKLISQMLASFSVPMTELIAHESELLIEKNLYGLSDTDLVRLIQQNINLDKTINMSNLRKNLQNNVKQQQKQPLTAANTTNNVSLNNAGSTEKKSSASARTNEMKILDQVRNTSPISFLQALRQHNNGFITDAEVRLLNDIAQLNMLPSEVINVILYELTVTQKKTTINRNYMQAIVNDWTQAKIKSAPQAFAYLKARSSKQREQNQAQAQKPKTYYNQNNNRRHVQEKRPDWEKQTVAKVSAEDKEAAAKLLAEFQRGEKE